MKIIIAEDELILRCEFLDFFEDRGHQVLAVGNGRDALRILESERIDAVFTDFDMPFLDGLGLMSRIRKLWPGVPVAVTSGAEHLSPEYWLAMGAVAFLPKPFTMVELEKVACILERKGASSG